MSAIEWTEKTLNPIRAHYEGKRGWHCERVSQGCVHCYAEKQNTTAARGGTGLEYVRASRDKVTFELDEKTLLQPLRWRKPQMVFVCSMTDLFGEWVPDEWIDRLFAVMALTPQHTYQVLTKRPERMRDYITGNRTQMDIAHAADRLNDHYPWPGWPLPNCWLGVSVEDQDAADQRIPVLLDTPAAVRFLSCEPLLGRVLLDNGESSWLTCNGQEDTSEGQGCLSYHSFGRHFHGIDWVIVGGESGAGARPCNVAWIRSIVEQCQAAQVPVFVKQLGSGYVHDSEYPRGNGLPEFSMTRYSRRKNRKGGDPADWPEDIRVRDMPR